MPEFAVKNGSELWKRLDLVVGDIQMPGWDVSKDGGLFVFSLSQGLDLLLALMTHGRITVEQLFSFNCAIEQAGVASTTEEVLSRIMAESLKLPTCFLPRVEYHVCDCGMGDHHGHIVFSDHNRIKITNLTMGITICSSGVDGEVFGYDAALLLIRSMMDANLPVNSPSWIAH